MVVACASDMTDSLASFRVRAVRRRVQEFILLSREDSRPEPTTSLLGVSVHEPFRQIANSLGCDALDIARADQEQPIAGPGFGEQ